MTLDPEAAVSVLLGRPVSSATVLSRTAIPYDPYLAGRAVQRVTGSAVLADGTRRPWAAVAKVTTGRGLLAARRELAAYRERIAGYPVGLAGTGEPYGLRAPLLLAWSEDTERVEMWIEEVHDAYDGAWPVERFGLAARHIGSWNARAAGTGREPGFDVEDAWAERHGQPERVGSALDELDRLARTSGSHEVSQLLGDPGFGRTHALIASTSARIDRLSAFPRTLLHHDLVRSNLFACDDLTTVAIDWETLGYGPLGVDLAPLVIGSVRRGEASTDDLISIEHQVLHGYEEGLREAGIDAVRAVRPAYRLAVGLRWHVVLGTIRSLLDRSSPGFRGSRRDEPRAEASRHLIGVSRHILDRGLDGGAG
jgi:hypothetical protein